MSMPIQRQSEAFGYFDEGPRHARDRSSTDLPRGLAGLINTSGPRITGGLLNTRTAVNTDGMDPNSHAYGGGAGDPLFGEFGHDGYDYEGVSRGEFNHRMRGYDPDEASARRREEIEDEDDDSGYNWGPEPHHASRHPFDRTAACQACGGDLLPERGSGWVHVDESDDDHDPEPDDTDFDNDEYGEHLDPARGMDDYESRREMQAARGGHDVPWEEDGEGGWHHPVGGFRVSPSDEEPGHYQLLSPHVGRGNDLVKLHFPHPDPHALMGWATHTMGGPKPTTKVGFAPAPADPAAAPQVPMGGGYQPAHRVGLPWRDQVIPGTVIGLDGPQVAVRWDDGQYSNEEPHNIQLL